jgi:arylsulfatase A-like enzyme
LSTTEIAGLQETNAQRREALLSAQDAVDQVLDTLDATGEADNTYVMFMSDNGYILGEHRIRGGKLAPYEVSNHVPFMVSGPGIAPGTVVDDVTAQVDFAPTVLAMAGLPVPPSVDGVDLLPRLTAGAAAPGTPLTRQGILLEATDTQSTLDPLPWLYRGVVSQRFKYVERTNGKKELYDLSADPSELVNQAGKSAYAQDEARLATLLSAYRSCAGAGCR